MTYNLLTVTFIVLLSGIGGFIIGMLFSKKQTEKYLKNNPPISEKQIRVMYQSMGRKPSEAQIQTILKNMGLK